MTSLILNLVKPDSPAIQTITPLAVLPLRQAILRPSRPLAEAVFPGDTDSDTVHLGALVAEEVVGVASLYHEPPPGEKDQKAWRLRGMAVAVQFQRRGIGGALLRAAVDRVREEGGCTLWCNARAMAVAFYQQHGWVKVGEAFSIPDVGPHYRMQVMLKE